MQFVVQLLIKNGPTVVCDTKIFMTLISGFHVGETRSRPDSEVQIIALYKWQLVILVLLFHTQPVLQQKYVPASHPAWPENASRCSPLLLRRLAYYLNFSFYERLF